MRAKFHKNIVLLNKISFIDVSFMYSKLDTFWGWRSMSANKFIHQWNHYHNQDGIFPLPPKVLFCLFPSSLTLDSGYHWSAFVHYRLGLSFLELNINEIIKHIFAVILSWQFQHSKYHSTVYWLARFWWDFCRHFYLCFSLYSIISSALTLLTLRFFSLCWFAHSLL